MSDYSLLETRFIDFSNKLKIYEKLCKDILTHPTNPNRESALLDEEEQQRETLTRLYGELSEDIHGMAGWDSFTQAGRIFNCFISALDPRLSNDNSIKWTGMQYAFQCLNKAIGSCRNAKSKPEKLTSEEIYIEQSRIDELKKLTSSSFDLNKLIKILEELNICFRTSCFYSVIFLVRALIDHIPPIFGYKTFKEVTNNYSGKSFKDLMAKLDESSRKIADMHLHEIIRKSIVLPNRTQISFKNEIDVLLAEIEKKLKAS